VTLASYTDLIRAYLSGQIDAENLAAEFNARFVNEPANSFDEEPFWLLEKVFESIEAYSPLWTPEEENKYRITEPTLRKELQTELSALVTYMTRQSPSHIE
jgi:hypothetical protein